MRTETRNIVNYFELEDKWQAEARSNCEDYESQLYLEPLEDQDPKIHALLDLSECMLVNDSSYDGIIGVSNNSAIGVKFTNSDYSEAVITYL